MTRALVRTVSLLLVATFATLASADVLCLLPCEMTTPAHHEEAAPAAADHCGATTLPGAGGPALAGGPESCAGQHAWEAPAADRTVVRVSLQTFAPTSLAHGQDVVRLIETGLLPASAGTPPPSLARPSAPLRI